MSAYVVSKPHIDLLVQAAIAGPSDGHGWKVGGEPFSYYHDGERHAVEIGAEPGARRGPHSELVGESVLGQRLVDENVRSVCARYDDVDPDAGDLPGPCDAYYMGPYVFEPYRRSGQRVICAGMPEAIGAPATIAQIAYAVRRYEYQACESADWASTEAAAFCRELKDALLASVPGESSESALDERVIA